MIVLMDAFEYAIGPSFLFFFDFSWGEVTEFPFFFGLLFFGDKTSVIFGCFFVGDFTSFLIGLFFFFGDFSPEIFRLFSTLTILERMRLLKNMCGSKKINTALLNVQKEYFNVLNGILRIEESGEPIRIINFVEPGSAVL